MFINLCWEQNVYFIIMKYNTCFAIWSGRRKMTNVPVPKKKRALQSSVRFCNALGFQCEKLFYNVGQNYAFAVSKVADNGFDFARCHIDCGNVVDDQFAVGIGGVKVALGQTAALGIGHGDLQRDIRLDRVVVFISYLHR